MSSPQGEPLHQSCGPLEGSSPVLDRRSIWTDLQEEGGHGLCLHLRLGSIIQGQIGIQLLVQPGSALTHQLPRDDGHFSSPKNLPTSLKRGPCHDNHQGGMSLHSLYRMVRLFLLWAQGNSLSLWAVQIPADRTKEQTM